MRKHLTCPLYFIRNALTCPLYFHAIYAEHFFLCRLEETKGWIHSTYLGVFMYLSSYCYIMYLSSYCYIFGLNTPKYVPCICPHTAISVLPLVCHALKHTSHVRIRQHTSAYNMSSYFTILIYMICLELDTTSRHRCRSTRCQFCAKVMISWPVRRPAQVNTQ